MGEEIWWRKNPSFLNYCFCDVSFIASKRRLYLVYSLKILDMKFKMRLYNAPFLILALLVGCGPQEGDIYENRLTRERIKIEAVGEGAELEKTYEEMSEYFDSTLTSTALKARLLRPPMLSDADSAKMCFAYEETSEHLTTTGGHDVTVMRIEPISELEENYRKVD